MKKKLIIIIGAVVLLLAIGAGLYFFVFAAPPPEKISSSYTPGDYFVTNIKDSSSLIKTTIVLEVQVFEKELEDVTAYLTENNHIIRDIIVFTLRSRTEEELRSQDIADTLRDELVQRINERLNIDYITTVYFNDYVIQ